jgi:hypothetical protein
MTRAAGSGDLCDDNGTTTGAVYKQLGNAYIFADATGEGCALLLPSALTSLTPLVI